MTVEISNDQKIIIINQHLSNLVYSKYNAELSVEEAKAVKVPDVANIDKLNAQISDIDSQIAKLEQILSTIPVDTTSTNAPTA